MTTTRALLGRVLMALDISDDRAVGNPIRRSH
jgi:hypothetical protein